MKQGCTRDIAARAMQARDEAAPHRVGGTDENDRYGRRRRLGCQRRWLRTDRNNDGHLPACEVGGKTRQAIIMALSPAIIEGDVSTLGEAGLIQTLPDDCD
jgi:hypothetical protein